MVLSTRISNTIATVPGVVSPALTGLIVKNHTQGEWRVVFYIAAIMYVAGVIVWYVFCKAEALPDLAKIDEKEKKATGRELSNGV